MKCVVLKPIDAENFLAAFALKLAEGQEEYVSHPIRSLAQAYVYRNQCTPFGIFDGDKMVGYVMVIYDDEIPEYDIWHMMIDRSEQGRGYGRAALTEVLRYIAEKPFGEAENAVLTCHKDNAAALHLYEDMGFAPTGNVDDDEIELARRI